MEIEEKAKCYDELFVKAQQIYNKENDVLILHTVEELFPELKESEDERIRKAIKYCIKQGFIGHGRIENVIVDDCLAWLEKQGERKEATCVAEIIDHLTEKEQEILFKELEIQKEQKPNYCHHEVDLSGCSEEYRKAYYDGWNNCNQQHAQLEVEQNPAWSEEDESRITTICTYLQDYARLSGSESRTIRINEYCDWLKSLKDRVQPKKEWSEEDERNIQDIDSVLFYDKNLPEDTCMRLRNWLKSLRPQNRWKPSDEQMLAVNTAIKVLGKGTLNGKQLIELQEQLKRLKRE